MSVTKPKLSITEVLEKSVLLFRGQLVCIYIYVCVCVAESFRQIYSATTLQLVVESPPGRRCGWLATPVCVWERERAREHYFHLTHTSSCSPHTPVTLTLPWCPLLVGPLFPSLSFHIYYYCTGPSDDTSTRALLFLMDFIQVLLSLCCGGQEKISVLAQEVQL